MAKNKRKSRDEINKDEFNLLKPIDIKKLGSEDDPCFGKHHDLLARECRVCGDSEFCSIATAQYLKVRNTQLEQTQNFKDVLEASDNLNKKKEEASKLVGFYKNKGFSKTKALLTIWEKTNLPKDEVKQLINKLWT